MYQKFSFFLFIMYLAMFANAAFAQQKSKIAVGRHKQILEASKTLAYLHPVDYQVAGEAQQSNGLRYDLETASVKEIIPSAIKTRTTWMNSGKNASKSVDVEYVDFAQLVPILVSAVQEHTITIKKLNEEIERLKKTIKAK